MENKKSLVPEVSDANGEFPSTDMSPDNMALVQTFIDEGMPGVLEVDQAKITKMVDLYLDGKTYSQISQICNVDKTKVMFFSQKGRWFETRSSMLLEMNANMGRRIMETDLESKDFIISLMQLYQKKIGKKVKRYLTTELEEAAEQINLKDIATYLKLRDALFENDKGKGSGNPVLGLNIGDTGATITRKGDNEIEITPKQKASGDILKHYADLRRKEEGNK